MAERRRMCDPCDPRPTRRQCPEPDTVPVSFKVYGLELPRRVWDILLSLGVLLVLIFLILGAFLEIREHIYATRENYACHLMGARLESLEPMYQNAPTCLPKGCSQFLGFNIFCDETYSPSSILKVGKEGWCLESDKAKIMIRLSQPSLVREIWMSSGSNWHSPGNVYTDTIREFEIIGFDGNRSLIFSKNLKMERWVGLQKFNFSQPTESYPRVDYILLDVKSNYGASETFLNRFVVMAVKEIPECKGICPLRF